MKRTIRLRESELKRMISESVKRVLNEWEYAGWTEDADDNYDYDYEPSEDEIRDMEIKSAWDEFDRNISNKRDFQRRREKFIRDLRNNPRRVQTSSTENDIDYHGAMSMAQLGGGPKGGWGKGFNMSRSEFDRRFLSGEAPKQDY